MTKQPSVAVIGGGSWATAIVKILTNNLDRVNWWMRNLDAIEHIQQYGRNPNYLQSVNFNADQLELYSDLERVVSDSDIIIMATPSAFIF